MITVKEEEVADAVAEIEALRALVADHDDVQALVVQLHQALALLTSSAAV